MPKAAVVWDDSYLIGIDDLDGEHRHLIGALAGLMTRAQRGEPMSALAVALGAFIRDFTLHAAKEAALLSQLKAPAGIAHRASHLALHDSFLGDAHALRDLFAAGNGSPAEIDRLGVLLTLVELIQADYEMAGHLKREGLLTP